MLTKLKPGDGMIPALSPTWPGIHCGFCWPGKGNAQLKRRSIRTEPATRICRDIVFAFLIRTLLKMQRTGGPSLRILVYVRFKPSSNMRLGVILLLHLLRTRVHSGERRDRRVVAVAEAKFPTTSAGTWLIRPPLIILSRGQGHHVGRRATLLTQLRHG